MDTPEKKSTKETYKKPELVVYGDIREITKSNPGTTGDDGSIAGNKKTA